MTDHIPVKIGRKRYVVVRDAIGVIRVYYDNAVTGRRNLDLSGRVCAALRAARPDLFTERPILDSLEAEK